MRTDANRPGWPGGFSPLRLCAILCGLAPALLAAADAAPPAQTLIRPAAIAKAARHPGPLEIEAEPTSELSKGFGTPLWAIGITSADGSFGHAAVLLVAPGSFLTPSMTAGLARAAARPAQTAAGIRADLEGQRARATLEADRARLTEQLAEFASITRRAPITRRIPLAANRVGYVTALGFSAGGATYAAALPAPDGRWEVLVVTGNSLEGEGRKPNAKSAAYERAMRQRPLDVTEAIARAVYAQLFPVTAKKKPAP
jgi:hypothetical protein